MNLVRIRIAFGFRLKVKSGKFGLIDSDKRNENKTKKGNSALSCGISFLALRQIGFSIGCQVLRMHNFILTNRDDVYRAILLLY